MLKLSPVFQTTEEVYLSCEVREKLILLNRFCFLAKAERCLLFHQIHSNSCCRGALFKGETQILFSFSPVPYKMTKKKKKKSLCYLSCNHYYCTTANSLLLFIKHAKTKRMIETTWFIQKPQQVSTCKAEWL